MGCVGKKEQRQRLLTPDIERMTPGESSLSKYLSLLSPPPPFTPPTLLVKEGADDKEEEATTKTNI